jgi:hypothetical protein
VVARFTATASFFWPVFFGGFLDRFFAADFLGFRRALLPTAVLDERFLLAGISASLPLGTTLEPLLTKITATNLPPAQSYFQREGET